MRPRRCVVLFTKPARPGTVKTRLIGRLTPAQAASLHRAFLDDLIERLAAGPFTLRLAWALTADEPLPAAEASGLRQRGGDLGERLFHGLTDAARDAEFVVAIGSDHPELEVERVTEAFERLEAGASGVLGPALDGGYYLIGFAAGAIPRSVFVDVPWSTPQVLAVTRQRFAEASRVPALLAPAPDVDTPADLEALSRRLLARPGTCPRTAALLAGWGPG